MLKKAIETLRDADPERLAIYEHKLAELTWVYATIGWRRFRTGPCGVEVEAKIGSKSVDVPISEEEALALAAGRAYVYTRSVSGAPSACRVEVRPSPAGRKDVHESRPRPEAKTSDVVPFEKRLAVTGREARIAAIDAHIERLANKIEGLQDERSALCSTQSPAA